MLIHGLPETFMRASVLVPLTFVIGTLPFRVSRYGVTVIIAKKAPFKLSFIAVAFGFKLYRNFPRDHHKADKT